ncbi:hypothetical protein P354_25380 [Streptomyces noursei PD-1]|nr:hypothetical protein P354_25380 [Streptomyces noursei PD-1]
MLRRLADRPPRHGGHRRPPAPGPGRLRPDGRPSRLRRGPQAQADRRSQTTGQHAGPPTGLSARRRLRRGLGPAVVGTG